MLRRIALVSALCVLQAAVASAQVIISEFRVRGMNGANDEFVELYNNSNSQHTVAGGGTGYALVASDGTARCIVPNGTIILARGHYLCINSVGFSLTSYPAGNGTTATGDATYTTDIPDNFGLALFNTSVIAGYTLANRLDAVGSTSEANTLTRRERAIRGSPPSASTMPSCESPLAAAPARRAGAAGTATVCRRSRRRRAPRLSSRTPTTTASTSSSWTRTGRAPAPASGWGARTGELVLAHVPRRLRAGGVEAGHVRRPPQPAERRAPISPPSLPRTRPLARSTSGARSPTRRASRLRGCGSASWTSRRSPRFPA